jgi:hypothetical protein
MDFWRLMWRAMNEMDGLTNDEAALRADAIARIKRRRRFVSSIVSYLAINGVLWLIWGLGSDHESDFPWPAWVSSIWAALMVLHALRAYGAHRPITEADIQRELSRGRPRP